MSIFYGSQIELNSEQLFFAIQGESVYGVYWGRLVRKWFQFCPIGFSALDMARTLIMLFETINCSTDSVY